MHRTVALAVAIVAAVGCDSYYGLKHWGSGGSDAKLRGVDSGSASALRHVAVFVESALESSTGTTFTSNVGSGDAIALFVGCESAAPVSISVTSVAWNWTDAAVTQTGSGLSGATFIAYTTIGGLASTTVTVRSSPCTSLLLVGDEFGISAAGSGSATFAGSGDTIGGSGQCGQPIKTPANVDAVWAACVAGNGLGTGGPNFSAGAIASTSLEDSLTEYELGKYPTGTSVNAAFTTMGSPVFVTSALTLVAQ